MTTLQDIQKHVGVPADGKLPPTPSGWMGRGRCGARRIPSVVSDSPQELQVCHAIVAWDVHAMSPASVPIEPVAPPLVSALVSICSPTAVLRAVWSIGVNSIQRMLRRWLGTHVFQECVRRFPPSFAHRNPTPSIQCVVVVLLPIASRFCGIVSLKLRGDLSANRMPVRQRARSDGASRKTSTALRAAALNCVSGGDHLFSALASKQPLSALSDPPKRSDDGQFAIGMWGNLSSRLHGNMI